MIKSVSFPNMLNQSSTRLVEDHQATVQNLRLLLLSDKYSLFGDPYYGTVLKRLMFEQNNLVLKDIVIDAIYTAILQFMPQVMIERKNITITQDAYHIYINIKAKNILDYQLDTYELVLNGEEIQ